MRAITGNMLHPDDKRHVLAAYVHRYNAAYVPQWACGRSQYKPQFRDDADWLAHTAFVVRKDGRLDRRVKSCRSYPTWPADTLTPVRA